MKKITTLLLVIGIAGSVFSQQDPLYSQYLFNPFIINPAYAGFSKDLSAQASYRLQWAGFTGAPETINATGHISLADNKMGLGLTLLEDKIGTSKTSEVTVAYAYHLQVGSNAKVSFGLQGGFINFRTDFDELTIDRADPKFQANISEITPSIGAGILYSSDRIFAGISVPKMLKSTTSVDSAQLILYNQHMYAHAAYLFNLSPRLKLKPFVLARATAGNLLSTDFGVSLNADNSYSFGLFTRNLHTYGLLAKIDLGDMLRIGYIFEMPTNKSVGLNYVSHEVTIGIRMKVIRFHDITSISDF